MSLQTVEEQLRIHLTLQVQSHSATPTSLIFPQYKQRGKDKLFPQRPIDFRDLILAWPVFDANI